MKPHLAIAGSWGYIGGKFVEAARDLDWQLSVYDPAPPPDGLNLEGIECIDSEEIFLELKADLFHLALHPEARDVAIRRLLARDDMVILNEKPMAAPENPADCEKLISRLRSSEAKPPPILLFDFPEIFDPVTARIVQFLGQFEQVHVDEIVIERSKDREARDNPRNEKRMVHIQYQETVHCFAFVLYLLGQLSDGPQCVLDKGIRIDGRSEPYDPPNPQDYDTVVDGKTTFQWTLGSTEVRGWTDFKAGAPLSKRRVLQGHGDGRAWQIEVDFLEGAKKLIIDGVGQQIDPSASSYTGVLQTYRDWIMSSRKELMTSTKFPNADFTRLTYQLSSALWRSCYDEREISIETTRDLLAFNAGFHEAQGHFERYADGGSI